MRKAILISVVIIFVALGGFFLWRWFQTGETIIGSSEMPVSVTDYRCSGGKTITATYRASGMELELSDGRTLMLAPAPAASGARYADETGSVVFWSKQYSAFLEESGQTSFEGCVVHPLPFAADAR